MLTWRALVRLCLLLSRLNIETDFCSQSTTRYVIPRCSTEPANVHLPRPIHDRIQSRPTPTPVPKSTSTSLPVIAPAKPDDDHTRTQSTFTQSPAISLPTSILTSSPVTAPARPDDDHTRAESTSTQSPAISVPTSILTSSPVTAPARPDDDHTRAESTSTPSPAISVCMDDRNRYPTPKCDGSTGICECPAGLQWDDGCKECVKACEKHSDCNSAKEICSKRSSRSMIGACLCRFGYIRSSAGTCIRDSTCKDQTYCLPHEVCINIVNGKGECNCVPGHQEIQHHCVKQCTSDADCGMAYYECFRGSCVCGHGRIWSNRLNGCLKQCTETNDCDSKSELCERLMYTTVCSCRPDHTLNSHSGECVQLSKEDT